MPETPAGPQVGLRHTETLTVERRHTVPQIAPDFPGFADMPDVFATAMMVAFIEETCIRGLGPFLSPQQRTVGTHVDVSHVAATPVGMTVTAEIELIEVDRRSLLFRVAARDESGLIGEGTHRRAIIDLERFEQRVAERRAVRSADGLQG